MEGVSVTDTHAIPVSRGDSARRRLLFVVLVAAYYATFIWTYYVLLVPWQGFWGFGDRRLTWEYGALSWLLVLLPALWCPLELRRPSQLLFLFQYLVMFIPANVVLYNCELPTLQPDDVLAMLLTMFAGLTLMEAIYLLPLLRLPAIAVPARLYWSAFYAVLAALALAIVVTLGRNLQFQGLSGIYSVRLEAADLVQSSGGSGLIWYLIGWFASVFLPVAFAVAMLRGSALLATLVTVGYLFLFGVTGTKTAMLGVVILWGLSRVTRLRGARFAPGFVVALSVLLLVPLVFDPFGDVGEVLQKWYVLIVHARIFGVPQLVFSQYMGFFAQHPLTWWSHIHGVDAMVTYPFTIDTGRLLGSYYYGTSVQLNAGPWTQDGIGAAGLGGILIASLVGALVLWVYDSLTARVAPAFVALASAALFIGAGGSVGKIWSSASKELASAATSAS